MSSPSKKLPLKAKPNKSKSSPKITSLMTSPASSKTKTSSIKLDNIPDDILIIILNRLDILHLIKVYLANKSFAKKKLVIELETVDLSNLKINKFIIDFIDKNLDKSKIKRLILNNTSFSSDEEFIHLVGNTKIFENVEEIQIKNTLIDKNCTDFFEKYWDLKKLDESKIKKLVLDSLSFFSDDDFDKLIYNIEYYQKLEELEINNFQYKYEGSIGYFNILIEQIRVLVNLKILKISNTDINTETESDTDLIFTDVFLETLEELVNLKHLIFTNNDIDIVLLRKISKKIKKKFKNLETYGIGVYTNSHSSSHSNSHSSS
jgi:hypothetical protein|uniref:F-box domain-containing protein n=1 Tax=viral metagenome TaxID=1070528 RepID=A0A6C0LVB1_9ZZZZ